MAYFVTDFLTPAGICWFFFLSEHEVTEEDLIIQ